MRDGHSDEIFRLAADQDAAHRLAATAYAALERQLRGLLPPGADIRHIGATVVAGCLTKGDLDIVVRVPADAFRAADTALARILARNEGSIRTVDFAAFTDPEATPPLGVQLTAIGGRFDDFHGFVERLAADPALVAAYNALKRRFNGARMDDYRAAKDAFILKTLNSSNSR